MTAPLCTNCKRRPALPNSSICQICTTPHPEQFVAPEHERLAAVAAAERIVLEHQRRNRQ